MPFIQIDMLAGRTYEQKKGMVKDVTDALVKNLNCQPDAVRIIIREMTTEHLSVGGTLRSEADKNK